MRTERTKRHMVADIDGTIAALERKEDMALALLDMHDFNQAIREVAAMKADGYEVIPSETCDNQEYNGRCKGHTTWKESDDGTSNSNQ